MPRWPAASRTTPRACPTANAVRTLAPKYSSSIAIASGACWSSSSPTRAWMSASRRSSGTPARVSITPSSSARRREPRLCDHAVAGAGGARVDAENDHWDSILRRDPDACRPDPDSSLTDGQLPIWPLSMFGQGRKTSCCRRSARCDERVAELEAERARQLRLDGSPGC